LLAPERNRSNTAEAERPVTNWFEDSDAVIITEPPRIAQEPHLKYSPIQIRMDDSDLRGELSPPPLRVPSGGSGGAEGGRSGSKPVVPTITTSLPPSSSSSSIDDHELKRKNSKWKALPARPKESSSATSSHKHSKTNSSNNTSNNSASTPLDKVPESPVDVHSPAMATTLHVGQLIRADKHVTHFFPPPPGPPPQPPINVYGKICLEIPRPDSQTMGAAEVKMAEIKIREATMRARSESPRGHYHRRYPSSAGRFSTDERLWLHKNYRGEVPFLRAWGLDIKSEEERDEGVGIMRELMAAERQKKERMKAEEERKERRERGLRSPHVETEDEAEDKRQTLKAEVRMVMVETVEENRSRSLGRPDESENVEEKRVSTGHTRQESNTSVTDEYLNSRISRFD
jgi:hypothetical protein